MEYVDTDSFMFRDTNSLYPEFLGLVPPENHTMRNQIVNFHQINSFPKDQGNCIICYENKTCYLVPCCHKEMCHECLTTINSEICCHCRQNLFL